MGKSEQIKKIMKDAINIGRWIPKTNDTYTFIEDSEREIMVENIIDRLNEKGYKIIKL